MRRLRTRRSLVLIGIGVAVFSALLPVFGSAIAAILAPVWILLPTAAVLIVRRGVSECDEQPVSLLSVLFSRAPPTLLSFA
jgi:hypothetical protein